MSESKDEKGQKDVKGPTDEKPVNKGGFGQFADKYRARWEATHPNAPKRWPTPATPESDAPASPDATADSTEKP